VAQKANKRLQTLPNASRKTGVLAPALNRAMQCYQIDSAVRQATFLVQIGHESGQLRRMHEIWGRQRPQ